LCEQIHSKTAQKIVGEIIEEHLKDNDLDYHLELLSILVEMGNHTLFCLIIKATLPLIKREEDFQDLLAIAIDYFHRSDQEQQEILLKTILEQRSTLPLNQPLQARDPDLAALTQLFNLKGS